MPDKQADMTGMDDALETADDESRTGAAMKTFKIDQDMDHAGMSDMKEAFDDLTRSSEDVCLDLSQVTFLDSAGLDGMVSVRQALRDRALKFGIIRAKGQPQHLLRQALPDSCVGPEWAGNVLTCVRPGAVGTRGTKLDGLPEDQPPGLAEVRPATLRQSYLGKAA